jgi:predicted transcriptional regulator
MGIESNGKYGCVFDFIQDRRRVYVLSSWKRGFLEIIAEILESLMANPLKKTHVTFKCNLDSRAVSKYLTLMMDVGLVERSSKDPSFFVITEKGAKYRNQYNSFVNLMEEDLQKISVKSTISKQFLTNLKPRILS